MVALPTDVKGPAAFLARLSAALAHFSCRTAPALIVLMGALSALIGYYAFTHLSVDTRTDRLLDSSLAWRAEEKVLNDAFPQNNHVLAVVVSGQTPELADEGALKLAEALRKNPGAFPTVTDAGGSAFLRQNGLLFLDTPDVQGVADQLIKAQGLLGTLIADPSLNGLFGALNRALQGVELGDIEASALEAPLTAIANTMEPALAGQPAFLSWRTMLTGLKPDPLELHRIFTVKPVLDYESLTPGEQASTIIRNQAVALGITPENGAQVRLTGDVALDDEEFSSVQKGMGVAAILSFLLVFVILFLAVRSWRAIVAILVTLMAGLIFSLGFAAYSVKALNLVSVAFVVMFIGIAVDFGIQFCVRYRDEYGVEKNSITSAQSTGRSIGGSLLLAAVTTAAGFLAFYPTGYKGVSELGIVAGAGMIIALILNLTLLPALLKLLRWEPGSESNGLFESAVPDEWIVRNKRALLIGAAALALAAGAALPQLRFDFDPLNLKDPKSESIRTLRDIVRAGAPGTNVMELLTSNRAELPALTARLEALPQVKSVTSIETFLPKDQDQKIKIIRDTAALILPSYDMAGLIAPADDMATAITMKETAQRLHNLKGTKPAVADRLASLLDQATSRPETSLKPLRKALLSGLSTMLKQVELMLQPTGLSEAAMPLEFKADWVSAQGQYRLEIIPKFDNSGPAATTRFINAVRAVAPAANGPAYFVRGAGDVVWTSFNHAFLYAFAGVSLILLIALARLLDVVLVVGPLIFSALLTLAVSILIGLPINFANVIALPLLMGIGVAFNIYFVANWRAGLDQPLRSSTARAVLLSACTTLTAFGSLSLSPHAGTASMGKLLTLSLGITLLTALIVLPALLAQFSLKKPAKG